MGTEEKTEDVELLEKNNEEGVETEQSEDTDEPDYRGKLNSQNRFLEKEGYKFEDGKWVKPQVQKPQESRSQDGLSNKDVIFLAKADIHEDDMDEVLDWAKFKKVPVSEAYKQLKTTLQVRTEERKSANTANTNNARRGSSKVDGETLMSQARTGKVPENDEDIRAVLKARMKQK